MKTFCSSTLYLLKDFIFINMKSFYIFIFVKHFSHHHMSCVVLALYVKPIKLYVKRVEHINHIEYHD